jgi:hypothetical protein
MGYDSSAANDTKVLIQHSDIQVCLYLVFCVQVLVKVETFAPLHFYYPLLW